MSSRYGAFKIVLLGDTASKTTLIYRYLTNIFDESIKMTIGADFCVKNLEIDGKKVKLQIWDFDVGKRFKVLLPRFTKGADGALFIYDVANHTSIKSIDDWLSLIRKEDRAEIPTLLVGIMSNEKNKRQVSVEEGKEIAKSKNLNGFIECNLKTGENVDKVFEVLSKLVLEDKIKNVEEVLVPGRSQSKEAKYGVSSTNKSSKWARVRRLVNYVRSKFIRTNRSSPKTHFVPPLRSPPPPKQPEDPVMTPQSKEFYRNQIIRLLSKLGSSLDLTDSRITAITLIKGRDTILYSTDNWDISADVGKVVSSWNSMNARFVMVSGVKYSVLQCTSERLVATSIRGEGHIIGARDEEHKILVYLKSDGEPMGATMNTARALSELSLKQNYLNRNSQLGPTGGNSKAYVRVNINPQLKGEMLSFLEWIKDSEGLSGYINYYLQQNNPSIISELSKIYSELRQIIEESLESSKSFNFNDSENIGDKNYDGDDYLPYPYIFTHPQPPDDFEPAPQSQLRAPLKENDSKDEISCQYCGRELMKEEQLTHSCQKKP